MNQRAKSLRLVKFIDCHNDPTDPYHLTEHPVVSVGHQFNNGVRFLCLTTQHLLGNMVITVKCGSQKQGHTDAAINFVWQGT